MVQVRDVALAMIFPFKADAAFMYDFKPHVCAQLHTVVLAADIVAVNHRPSPLSGYKKGAPLIWRAPLFCCSLTLSFYHMFDSYLLLSFKRAINFRIHAARI